MERLVQQTDGFSDEVGIVGRSFAAWGRCIVAMMAREIRMRFSRSGGMLGAFLEPFGLLIVVISFHYVMESQTPPYGNSIVLFYSSGILYHFTFMWIAAQSHEADRSNLPFPTLQDLDTTIAGALVQFGLMVVIMLIFALALEQFGIDAMPWDPIGALEALGLAGMFGLGVAILNSAILPMFRMWHMIYQVFIRCALLMSGGFFIPDFLSPFTRSLLSWMPLLHGMSWFRATIMRGYPTMMVDKQFYLMATLVVLTLGLALERATRKFRAFR
jgi:capsular polysaccharide transport system permease protein